MSTMNKDSEYKRLPTPARVEDFGFGECVLLMTDEESLFRGRLLPDEDGYVLLRHVAAREDEEVMRCSGEESVKKFLERCGCLGGYFRGLREWFCVGVSGVGLRFAGAYLDCLVTDGLGFWRVGARCGERVCLHRVCGEGESLVRVDDVSWSVFYAPDVVDVTEEMVREMWGIPEGVGVFYCGV